MSTLSWNCRGLGNPRTVREVTDLVSRKKPEFVFLMETKVGWLHAERLRVKLGFDGLFYVDNDGMAGGLALLWKKNNTARLLSYSKNHVDVEVSSANGKVWRMTCFCGQSDRNMRTESWDLLLTLSTRSQLPWIVMGDFNDLLYQHEKRGGNPHRNNLLRWFGEVIDGCALTQLPMSGYRFTWEMGEGTDMWIEERLDKVLATDRWHDMNGDAGVENIRTRNSDHLTLFLRIDVANVTRNRPRGFRFEMACLLDEGCREVVETAWQDGRTEGLLDCQQYCGHRLMRWGGDHFHNFGDRIKRLRERQEQIRSRRDPAALAEFQHIETQLRQLEV
ncbi:PREDICTED: uncharacterized protein LOC109193755 [Ipomoea nil]|uniref:uncharacterized protein LOC109193755 n=1 Tax=Ipomoea nil TaxID=35883 RepID=UPI0009016E77|nr:PREDICTED: uncharacterized protein LOC109193755 [Ipomoea nil]